MDLHTALRTRRTVQRYTDSPVPDAVLLRALEAAHHAPCHKLTWPWRFALVGPEGREALVQLAIRLKAEAKQCDPERMEGPVRSKLGSAPQLVLVSQVLDPDPFRREEDYAATCCAVQNLMLSLHADGFGSKWSTGGFTRAPETYALLGVAPEDERLVGCVLVGKAVQAPNVPPRNPLAEVVRRIP